MTASYRHLTLRVIAAICIGTALAMPFPASVFSQGGSVEAVRSKDADKSLSGDRQVQAPARPKRSAPPKTPATRLFHDPEINGVRLDRCLQFGSQCDEPAATAWCKSHGLSRKRIGLEVGNMFRRLPVRTAIAAL